MFEMEQALGNEINKAVVGQITAKEALDNGAAAWQRDHGEERLLSPAARPSTYAAVRRRRPVVGEGKTLPSADGDWPRPADPSRCRSRTQAAATGGSQPHACARRSPLHAQGVPLSAGGAGGHLSPGITLYPGVYRDLSELLRRPLQQLDLRRASTTTSKLLGDREFWAACGTPSSSARIALALEFVDRAWRSPLSPIAIR